MNLEELAKRLAKTGIHPTSYSLTGGDPDGAYAIEQRSDGWHVYVAERGERFDDRTFASEDEACTYFLATILQDHGAR